MNWEDTIECVVSGRSLASLLQFPSKEEEDRLNIAMRFCNACRLYRGSGDSQDEQGEYQHAWIGFIEREVKDLGNTLGAMRDSGIKARVGRRRYRCRL